MSNTPRMELPLLQPAQAQKHVTVNEALVRLDALGQLVLQSLDVSVPPTLASEGDCYAIASGGVNAWSGRDGDIAIWSNGGWVFARPGQGWRAWVADLNGAAVHDGTAWVRGAVALSANGAGTVQEVLEYDHTVASGTTSAVTNAIPAHSIVLGVTGRVLTDLTGTLATWRLGVALADNRYGAGLGPLAGSWVRGLTSAPQAYYAPTDLLLTAEGGDFAAGSVRLAVHMLRLTLPNP